LCFLDLPSIALAVFYVGRLGRLAFGLVAFYSYLDTHSVRGACLFGRKYSLWSSGCVGQLYVGNWITLLPDFVAFGDAKYDV